MRQIQIQEQDNGFLVRFMTDKIVSHLILVDRLTILQLTWIENWLKKKIKP